MVERFSIMDATVVAKALVGGVLIGGAASGLLLFNGRIAGISNIVAGLFAVRRGVAWRLSFVLGLLAGGAVLVVYDPLTISTVHFRSLPELAVAGLLVGVGTRLSNGCTSGHGVCGLARARSEGVRVLPVLREIESGDFFLLCHP